MALAPGQFKEVPGRPSDTGRMSALELRRMQREASDRRAVRDHLEGELARAQERVRAVAEQLATAIEAYEASERQLNLGRAPLGLV